MRFFTAAALVIATAACGAGAAGDAPVVFGIEGGNVIPYRVALQPDGRVRLTGSPRTVRRRIAPAQVRRLRREIESAHLASRRCAGVLPDLAARYVRVGSRRFTVRGDCEPGFERVWSDLTRAVSRS
jgi:hypothetical protein